MKKDYDYLAIAFYWKDKDEIIKLRKKSGLKWKDFMHELLEKNKKG